MLSHVQVGGKVALTCQWNMVDILRITVAVCLSVRLCPFAEHVVSVYFRNFEFSLQLSSF